MSRSLRKAERRAARVRQELAYERGDWFRAKPNIDPPAPPPSVARADGRRLRRGRIRQRMPLQQGWFRQYVARELTKVLPSWRRETHPVARRKLRNVAKKARQR